MSRATVVVHAARPFAGSAIKYDTELTVELWS
jgi:hypothetical protein